MRITVIIVFLSMFFQCGERTQFTNELAEIDNMLQRLDSLEKNYQKIDTALLKEIQVKVKSDIKNMEQQFDTLPPDIAFYLSEYAYPLKKQYKRVLQRFPDWKESIEYSRQQLNDLKHDLQKNLIDSAKAFQYLNNEKNFLMSIESEINELGNAAMNYAKTFDSKQQRLYHLVDSLKQVKN